MTTKPAHRQNNLLLYSMICFRDLIEPLLALAKPRSICEIGVEKGLFTQFLLDYCNSSGANYNGIDPSLDVSFISEHSRDGIVFYRERSLPALERLKAHDVYFIDGDHNYFTVKNELRLILRHRNHWPLIFLHDVCWPWGRRDQYCAPELIPAEHRHPFSTELAVVPGDSSLHGSGFCGKESDYQYAAALHEGGPCNGVLTAVEDVIAEKEPDNLRLLMVPAIFGLGLLYSPAHLNPELWLFIERVASGVNLLHSLLNSLERNRIDLFLTYLQQVKQLQTIHQRYSELDGSFSDLLSNYRQAEGESGRLLLDYNSLQSAYDELTAEFNALQRKYAELHQTYRDLEGAYDGLEEHNKTLQSSYDELLRYTKWLETNATVNKAK